MKVNGLMEYFMVKELSYGLMVQGMKETMSMVRSTEMVLLPTLQGKPMLESGVMESKKGKALSQMVSQTFSSRELGQMEGMLTRNDSI